VDAELLGDVDASGGLKRMNATARAEVRNVQAGDGSGTPSVPPSNLESAGMNCYQDVQISGARSRSVIGS